jgi:hypothetical protein
MTPGERLKRILDERNLGKSKLARLIVTEVGGACAYHNVHRWTLDREFTPRNQERAARALGLAPDYFTAPDAAEQRERHAREVFETFLQRPLAQLLTPGELDILASMKFTDPAIRPTVALYETFAAFLRGLVTAEEIADVAAHNAELDRTVSGKSPPRRR